MRQVKSKSQNPIGVQRLSADQEGRSRTRSVGRSNPQDAVQNQDKRTERQGLTSKSFGILLLKVWLLVFGAFFWGCVGELEPVTSDHEPVLNVFGFVSLDNKIPSFVVVHKTLGLEGSEWEIIGSDTIWYGDGPDDYWIYIRRESKYLVRDATVIISDGETDYMFTLIEDPSMEDSSWLSYGLINDEAIYMDTSSFFTPSSSTAYTLNISTPNGMTLTGELTTPPMPQIHTEMVPDTLYNKNPYTITWVPIPDHYVIIRNYPYVYICGANQWDVLELGDSSWTSSVPRCEDDRWGYDEPDTLEIQIMAADENYYEYFIKHAYEDEFVNFLLGGGSSGLAYGVEGGFGVFGSIATDRIQRILVP